MLCRREQARDRAQKVGDANPGQSRTEVHGIDQKACGLFHESPAKVVRRDWLIIDEATEEVVVVEGQRLDSCCGMIWIVEVMSGDGNPLRPDISRCAHCQDVRIEAFCDGFDHSSDVGADPVDLVYEDQRRHPQPSEDTEEQQSLRLDAFNRRDNEHGAIENTENSLDLCDEVRVAWGVHQVDRHVVHHEGHHR